MQHETFLVYISFQGQIILQLAKVFGAFLSSHQMLGTFTASAGLFFMAEALQLGIHVAHAGLMPSGDVVNAYPFFVVGVLHLISSAVLGFGGLYHAALGPEILTAEFFAYSCGGDVRVVTQPTLSLATIFGYILISPFGGDGWIVTSGISM